MGFRVLRCGVLNVHGVRHHALPSKGAEESLTTARQNLFMKRFVQRVGALLREKLRQGGVVGSSFASSTGVIDPTEAARLAATFGNIRRHTRVTRS